MKSILPILLILITVFVNVNAAAYDEKSKQNKGSQFLDEVRFLYFLAIDDEDKLKDFEKLLASKYKLDVKTNPPIILAYFGAVEALKAKHASWPFTKNEHLNKAMDNYKQALKKDPNNLEIRFMRFSTLIEVPGIVGWGEEEENDKKVIVQLLLKKENEGTEPGVKKVLAEFMIAYGDLSEKDSKLLKNMYVTKKKAPQIKKLDKLKR